MFDINRIHEALAEAREDLRRYDDLRANTEQLIATLEKRLRLLGADIHSELPLPGVDINMRKTNNAIKNGSSHGNGSVPTFKDRLQAVLMEANEPMATKDIWDRARSAGAQTTSTNPLRNADSTLREMVRQGRIQLAGPGLFRTFPKSQETQAAT